MLSAMPRQAHPHPTPTHPPTTTTHTRHHFHHPPSPICSWLGLAAVTVWVAVTLALVVIAAATGAAHPIQWLPDMDAFSGGRAQVALQILGVIPVLATAYTCQVRRRQCRTLGWRGSASGGTTA